MKGSHVYNSHWFAAHGWLAGENRKSALRQLEAMRARALLLSEQYAECEKNISDLEKRLG
jgi:hypothetical protein